MFGKTGLQHIFVRLIFVCLMANSAFAQTTTFSCKGRLNDAGNPTNGSFQMQFRLIDALAAGRQIVRQQIKLSDDENSYTAAATAQVLDVNGNVIANNCAAGTGTRFELI